MSDEQTMSNHLPEAVVEALKTLGDACKKENVPFLFAASVPIDGGYAVPTVLGAPRDLSLVAPRLLLCSQILQGLDDLHEVLQAAQAQQPKVH